MPTSKSPKLSTLSTKELHARFQAVLGIPTRSNNRPWMIKRIANAPTAQRRAKAPANRSTAVAATACESVSEIPPTTAGRSRIASEASGATVAMPAVGAEIRRTWRGQELIVTVQADGFLLNGTVYRSLSAAASALCGGNRNGLVFFGLKTLRRRVTPEAT
jgi:hypothetical protein